MRSTVAKEFQRPIRSLITNSVSYCSANTPSAQIYSNIPLPRSEHPQKMDRGRYETPYGRDQYEWCLSERISAFRGTPYPCDQYDLDECTFGSDRPPRSQHSRTSATANLENFLHPGARIDSVVHAAVARLRAGLRIHDWRPDLVIKAFNDLDIVFFGGKLRGHTTIRWYRASWWIQQLRSPQGHHHLLARTKYLHPRKAAIQLNAWNILLNIPNTKEAMFTVTLHEMVVSAFLCHTFFGIWNSHLQNHFLSTACLCGRHVRPTASDPVRTISRLARWARPDVPPPHPRRPRARYASSEHRRHRSE